MIIVEVYAPKQDAPIENQIGYFNDNSFVKSGIIGVPFVTWKKDKEPNEHGIKETIGSVVVTKSKIVASRLTEDSRLKIGERFFRITSLLQSVNQIFTISFVYVQVSGGSVVYEEPVLEEPEEEES